MLPTTTTKKGGGYKKYNIIYVVFEKEWQCAQYPADGEVTFFNIKAYYEKNGMLKSGQPPDHKSTALTRYKNELKLTAFK